MITMILFRPCNTLTWSYNFSRSADEELGDFGERHFRSQFPDHSTFTAATTGEEEIAAPGADIRSIFLGPSYI